MVALAQSRLMYITERKADLQLRIMILTSRQQRLAAKAYQVERDLSEFSNYSNLMNMNSNLVNTWMANNPGMSWQEGVDANPDLMPQLYEIPSGYASGEINIDALESNAELELMLINQAETALELERNNLQTEYAALEQEEKQVEKLRDKNVKNIGAKFYD